MSTKNPLRSGPHHCLYADCFDHSAVYLEISGGDFFAQPNKVTVRIPLPIWEHVRGASSARFDLAVLNARQLRAHVTALWRQRQQRIRSSRKPALDRALGAAIWSGKSPKAELASGLRWHRREQRKQRQLIAELKRLRNTLSSEQADCRAEAATQVPLQSSRNAARLRSAVEDRATEQNRGSKERPVSPVKPDLCSRSGRPSPPKLARLYGVPLAELRRWARQTRDAQGDFRTSGSQATLEVLAKIAAWRLTCGNGAAFREWLNSNEPMLEGHSPMHWIRRGKLQEIADYVMDALSGQPT